MKPEELTLEEAEALAVCPAEEWGGQCHGISMAIAPAVGGLVQRGYYLGTIEPGTYWAERGGLSQHSWVQLPDRRVLDPTRFSFKGGEPELWIGRDEGYDIGGCKVQYRSGTEPPPGFYEPEDTEPVELNLGCVDYVLDLVGSPAEFSGDDWIEVGLAQARWLAHAPILEDTEASGALSSFFAPEIYEALVEAGHEALIPIDRLHWMLPEKRGEQVQRALDEMRES